ncbi:MAG: class I SAM-dependent methyltransferase [Bacteroidota bacterium]
MIVILYTTKYRLGGDKFTRIANTLAAEKKSSAEVLCTAVESKRDVLSVLFKIKQENKFIQELHFIGHSGMYGPMFGMIEYPEQFSPHEWRTMDIPFEKNAAAYFRCCRSARWFARFFANTFYIPAYGYFWYTTFSGSPEKYIKDAGAEKPLYAIGCKGMKSHGITGSLKKYAGMQEAEQMIRFDPEPAMPDRSYDRVAALYADVFSDIKVRKDEWKWMHKHFPDNLNQLTMLDVGCGNGALLQSLSGKIKEGIGVDNSPGMIDVANASKDTFPNLQFHTISGPSLPLPDQSVDLIISLLSFRYLDWDPIMAEFSRIMKPGGKMLIIDMVAAPVKYSELPRFFFSKIKYYFQRIRNPKYYGALKKMVNDPDWKKMVQYNPMRAQHEYRWYLESRFPGRKAQVINIGWSSRILAFDTGDFEKIKPLTLTYP